MPIVNRATVLRNAVRFKKLKGTSVVSNSFNRRGVKRNPFLNEWVVSRTPFNETDARFNFKISKCISDLILERKHGVRVLDWGCGEGFALFDCAQKFSNLRVFGFSRDSYYKWLEFLRYNDKGNLDFVFSSHKVFERYLIRRKLKFNLIFEHSSLVHLFQLDLVKHLNVLVKHLTVGGKIFVSAIDSPNWSDFSEIKKELTKMGVSVSVNDFGAACLTRVK